MKRSDSFNNGYIGGKGLNFLVVDSPGILSMSKHFVAGTKFLLDNISTTGLVEAASYRRLRGAYNGALAQMRRSTDSAVLDIGSNGEHFDVTSMNSFIGSVTGYTRILYSQAGLGSSYDFVQGTNAKQPIVRLSGTNYTMGGRVCMMGVPGNDTGLATSNIANLITGTDFTCILVASVGAHNNYARFFSSQSAGGSNDYGTGGCSITQSASNNTIAFTGGTNSYCYPNGTSGNVSGNVVFTVYTNSTGATVRANGALQRTEPFVTNHNSYALGIMNQVASGGGASLNQLFSEIIVFKRTLSLSEIQTIERNMGTYWGISVA
ncbi:MAG: hypothetical protein LCH91_14205 [Bacteroidetes bacterium]|nr:hypothetical protein [Bacteroidota bacterium]